MRRKRLQPPRHLFVRRVSKKTTEYTHDLASESKWITHECSKRFFKNPGWLDSEIFIETQARTERCVPGHGNPRNLRLTSKRQSMKSPIDPSPVHVWMKGPSTAGSQVQCASRHRSEVFANRTVLVIEKPDSCKRNVLMPENS